MPSLIENESHFFANGGKNPNSADTKLFKGNMLRFFLLIPILTACLSFPAYGYDVLVIQSLRDKSYEEALRGFRSACPAKAKRLVLSELAEADVVRTVREEQPELVLAVGAEALTQVKKLRQVPIVYLMVLTPSVAAGNITGISMTISPEREIAFMKAFSPHPQRIGILYNQRRFGTYVKNAQSAARAAGIELIAREVQSPKDVPLQMQGMKEAIDFFWMLPDPTFVTNETVEFILLFAQQNRIPVVTFTGRYVEMGASASLDIDFFDMGKQAGEMAQKILDGTPVSDVPRTHARKTTPKVNRNVIKNLGISVGLSGD